MDRRTAIAASGGRGMTRREMLRGLGFGVGAAVVVAGCTVPTPGDPRLPPPGAPDAGPFPDGVMAGDPAPDGTVLWTRVPHRPTVLRSRCCGTCSDDPSFGSIRAAGLVTADGSDRSHRVRRPSPACSRTVGTTTASKHPAPTARRRSVGRAACGPRRQREPCPTTCASRSVRCQQLNDSWFDAHAAIAAEPGLDFFMHLGDYVYVSDHGTLTLDELPRLPTAAGAPSRCCATCTPHCRCVAMWDDGEFYNGVDRLGSPERLAAAKQAWFESFPSLVRPPTGRRRTYRALRVGRPRRPPVIDVRCLPRPVPRRRRLHTGARARTYDPAAPRSARRSTTG